MNSTSNRFRAQLPKNLKNKLHADAGGSSNNTTIINVTNISEATPGGGVAISPVLKVDNIQPISQPEVTIDSSLVVNGNLVVKGTVSSVNETNVDIVGRYIYQGSGNTIPVAVSCGLVQNVLPSGTNYALFGSFVPGDANSNGFVSAVNVVGLAANQIVQISGSELNSGLFEILARASVGSS